MTRSVTYLIMKEFSRLVSLIPRFFFYNYNNAIICKLPKGIKSLMDAGTGLGIRMERIKKHCKEIYLVGVDLFLPYLKSAKKRNVCDDYVLADVRHLPFKQNSFDVVLCTEVIEHLAKDEAVRALFNFDEIACKRVIIGTPSGYLKELPSLLTSLILMSEEENPLLDHPLDHTKAHMSGFRPAELKKMGYKVFGVEGFRLLYCKASLFSLIAAYLTGPLAYFIPETALQMICIKDRGFLRSSLILS